MKTHKELLAEYYSLDKKEQALVLGELFFFGHPGLNKEERLRLMYLLMYIVDGVRIKQKKEIPASVIIKKIVGEKFDTGLNQTYQNLAMMTEMLLSQSQSSAKMPVEQGLTSQRAITEVRDLLTSLLPF